MLREGYKGVCVITYGSSEIRRAIGSLAKIIFRKLNDRTYTVQRRVTAESMIYPPETKKDSLKRTRAEVEVDHPAKRALRSYPPCTREKARKLRRQGYTYREIEETLGGRVPKNTINYWVSDIELTVEQKARIKKIELAANVLNRGNNNIAELNKQDRQLRWQAAEEWATVVANRVIDSRVALFTILAGLWAAEGDKNDERICFANSDAIIIAGWLGAFRDCFEIDESRMRCILALSADMPEADLISFWSDIAKVPVSQFTKSSIDYREKTKTKEGYKGVCKVVYGSAEIRRKLGALAYFVFDKLKE